MISSFIKFYKNFTDYFKASSSVSTFFTIPEALLAGMFVFFVAFFTLETTLSKFSFALSDRFPYSDFTFFQILYRIHLMLDLLNHLF